MNVRRTSTFEKLHDDRIVRDEESSTLEIWTLAFRCCLVVIGFKERNVFTRFEPLLALQTRWVMNYILKAPSPANWRVMNTRRRMPRQPFDLRWRRWDIAFTVIKTILFNLTFYRSYHNLANFALFRRSHLEEKVFLFIFHCFQDEKCYNLWIIKTFQAWKSQKTFLFQVSTFFKLIENANSL